MCLFLQKKHLMAKFQSNHSNKGGASSGVIVKVGIFGAIMAGLFFVFNTFTGGDSGGEEVIDEYAPIAIFYPESTSGEIIVHKGFALSYNEEHEQAEWTAHELTKENLEKDWNSRNDNFLPDTKVRTGSATPDDYRGSGYDRGHLVPAADLAWDSEAMAESFLLSNISPQSGNFNKGIWRELEELTRNWAKKNGSLFVITGPVLTVEPKGVIGENEVSVPVAYYKVLLDYTEPGQKGIAFVIPNEVSYEPLFTFCTSIDEVEALTGINFFPDLLDGKEEETLEGSFNKDLWPFNKKKFEIRNNSWNKLN
jgi:endonuclease G